MSFSFWVVALILLILLLFFSWFSQYLQTKSTIVIKCYHQVSCISPVFQRYQTAMYKLVKFSTTQKKFLAMDVKELLFISKSVIELSNTIQTSNQLVVNVLSPPPPHTHTQYLGVNRNHPVHLSVHMSCKCILSLLVRLILMKPYTVAVYDHDVLEGG